MRVLATLLLLCATARADEHDWAIGVELSAFSHPQGHLGAPLGEVSHLAPAVYARLHVEEFLSSTFGAGLPSAQGLSAWGGLEARHELCANLELFGGVAVQLGFVGPDYYQRNDNEFVGYAYAISGAVGLGGRIDAGLRSRFLDDRFEAALQAVDVVTRPIGSTLSSADNILSFQLALGVRL